MASAPTLDDHFERYRSSKSPRDLAPVFQELAPELVASARRAGLDAQRADDVVQETFLALIQAEARFEAGMPVRPWVHGIAKRQIGAEKRRRARDLHALGRTDALEDALTDEVEARSRALDEVRAEIWSAVRTLSEGNRRVVAAALFDGHSVDEIARDLGLTPTAVTGRLYRGLRRVRERLGERASLGLLAIVVPRTGMALPTPAPAALTVLASVAAVLALLMGGAWALFWSGSGAERSSVERAPVTLADRAPDAAFAAEVERRVPSERDEPPTPVDDARTVRGRVVRANGTPAVGAQVFLLQTTPDIVLPTEPMLPAATVDADGSYTLTSADLGLDATPLLLVRDTGEVGWGDAPPGTLERGTLPDINLEPEFVLGAEVVDGDGAPVEGATVAAFTDGRFLAPGGAAAERFGYMAIHPYRHLFGAVSDAQGRAVIHGMVGADIPGLFVGCTASKPGYARTMRAYIFGDGARLDVRFVLRRVETLTFAGRVIDEDGAPLGGAAIRILARGEAEPSDAVVAVSAPDGSWSLPNALLDEFPMFVECSHAGFFAREIMVERADDLTEEPFEVVLERAVSLSGRVVDADGAPVAGARVSVSTTRSLDVETTDAEGRFRLDHHVRSARVVSASDAGATRVVELAVPAHESDVEIALPAAGPVARSVELRSPPGTAWVRAVLAPLGAPGAEPRRAELIEAGLAHFTDVPAGQWLVAGVTADSDPLLLPVEVAGTGSAAFDVPLLRTGTVECVVAADRIECGDRMSTIVARHATLPPLPAWLMDSVDAPVGHFIRNASVDEPCALQGLVPGRWQISLAGPGWCTAPAEVEVEPGAHVRLDLVPEPAARLELHVPAVGRAAVLCFELQRDALDPWHVVAWSPLNLGYDEVRALWLPAGEWSWRATLLGNTGDGDYVTVSPVTHGKVRLALDAPTALDVLEGSFSPID